MMLHEVVNEAQRVGLQGARISRHHAFVANTKPTEWHELELNFGSTGYNSFKKIYDLKPNHATVIEVGGKKYHVATYENTKVVNFAPRDGNRNLRLFGVLEKARLIRHIKTTLQTH